MFISNDKVNVAGIVLAGSADFKNDLAQSDIFDQRLVAKVIKTVDVSYGGENGFNQAIELSSETLSNVKFVQEKKLITKFLDEVAQDTGKYVFGIKDTMYALEMGAVDTLILWESVDLQRIHIKNPHTDKEHFLFVTQEESKDEKHYRDPDTGVELTVEENKLFVEWIVETYKSFGTNLDFITDRSQEGNQFCKGFGGIGGILRYRVEFETFAEPDDIGPDSDDDFM